VLPESPDSKELGFYFSLAQVGLEMVLPIVLGLALDYYFSWAPWATVAGAILGLAGGLAHLVLLLNRSEQLRKSKERGP
jgi:hypothetical protein